eukprot:gene26894-4504_t
MMFKDEINKLHCELEVDPQPQQTLFQSWFKSKKAAGYKPDMITGTLYKGEDALDHCTGNWLHTLDWVKGISSLKMKNTKRLWDIRTSRLGVQQSAANPLESDCRHRKDLVYLKAQVGSGGPQGLGQYMYTSDT